MFGTYEECQESWRDHKDGRVTDETQSRRGLVDVDQMPGHLGRFKPEGGLCRDREHARCVDVEVSHGARSDVRAPH